MNGSNLRAMLAPLQRQVAMMAARAVVRMVDDIQARQRLQLEILADELQDDVERAQDYGFTSHPLPGCDGFLLCSGGSREQAVAVAVDDRRYRPRDLAPGEVALYTDEGDRIVLKRGRVVEVTAGARIRVDAPEAEFTGSVRINGTLAVQGDITFAGAVTANGKRIDDTHTHTGVQPGGGVSGVPA